MAGMFYPGDPGVLRRDVEGFLSGSGGSPDPAVIGIVSPHAGYVYSGRTAGAAFACAPRAIHTVVILAPAHRRPVRGASIYAGSGYLTPLGLAGISTGVVDRLRQSGHSFEPAAHAAEHAEEVQIPFVQVRWPDACIVPILQGDSSLGFSRRLASDIRKACEGEEGVFLVASSDLSHYHDLTQARDMDSRFLKAFESGDPSALEHVLSSGAAEACGGGPVITLLEWARAGGAFATRILAYDTSATATGDSGSVVGYMAGCIMRCIE